MRSFPSSINTCVYIRYNTNKHTKVGAFLCSYYKSSGKMHASATAYRGGQQDCIFCCHSIYCPLFYFTQLQLNTMLHRFFLQEMQQVYYTAFQFFHFFLHIFFDVEKESRIFILIITVLQKNGFSHCVYLCILRIERARYDGTRELLFWGV